MKPEAERFLKVLFRDFDPGLEAPVLMVPRGKGYYPQPSIKR
ncbi:hypothetical protein [Tropicimonas marinistellae]|nr:hypothetical protein [Tropicimonas marinistellae]